MACRINHTSRLAQVHQRLQNLILGFYRLRVGLVHALRDDHVDQFGGEVDVGIFHRTRL